MQYLGALIRRKRLEKNWSQAGLSKGICTVSYLSKIEQGKAEPSAEILDALLLRLGVARNASVEADAAQFVRDAYESLFSGDFSAFFELFKTDYRRFETTASGLHVLLLACAAGLSPLPDAALVPCMDARALALYRVLEGNFEEAIRLHPNAYFHFCAGKHAYENGRYQNALAHLRTGYELAAECGAARLMMECKTRTGNCMSDLGELAQMLAEYDAARRLAVAVSETDVVSTIDYNIASSYIESGDCERAYAYFSSLTSPSMLALHKLAICCEKTGRTEEALAALDRADAASSEYPPTETVRLFLDVVRYRLQHPEYLAHAAYGELLLHCFERCRKELPAGYAVFHLPWVLEWYRATRQYKKALDLLSDFPNIRS